jgi:catecholate siderophore receptor
MRSVLNDHRDNSTVRDIRILALALLAAGVLPTVSAAQRATFEPPAIRATTHVTLAADDTTARFAFDIPAQPLRDALVVFGRQSGLRVDTRDLADAESRTRTLSGHHTAPEALRRLLAGTRNRAVFRDAATVVVAAAEPLEAAAQTLGPVVVTAEAARRAGYAPRRTISAAKIDLPLRDVPQSVTVVSHELIADQGMQSMADVVRYIPGITMGQGEGHRDAPTIRGNSSTADFFVDGVRDDVQYLRDLYNVERVEALKGSNAMIFGRGGGGGIINRVTKDAQWMPTRSLTLEGGMFDHKRAMLDVGSGLGRALAARVNGVLESSGSFRDATGIEREGINPTAAILAGGTLVRLGYEYFADRRTVNRGIPSFQGRPLETGIATFFGDPDESRSRAAVHAADATVERGSADRLLLRNRSRFARYDKFYANVLPGAVNDAGTDVALSAYSNATDRRNLFNQTDLTWAVGGGAVRQTLLAGVEVGRQWTENFRRTGYFEDGTTAITVPVDRPTVDLPITFAQSATDADNRSDATVAAVYLQDRLALGSHVQAIVGVRHDRFALDFHDERTGGRLERTDRMLSPRAGLVVKPVEPLSFYGTWSVSHLPASGDQFSSLTVTTQALEPERFVNREAGIKWDLRSDLSLTAAAYRLDRSNTTAPDPAEPTRIVQTGRQRTTGVEAGLSGHVTDRWQVAGGWSAQRATIVDRTTAAQPGARVPLVPAYTISLWNRYRMSDALAAGLGVVRQADMYAAVDNSVTLPAFTRVDAALFVRLMDGLRAQLNVENVLDARYYATSHGNNNIMPGAPRTLRLSLTAAP